MKAEGAPAGRSGVPSRGVTVQAAARVGAGPATPAGCGAPRGRGSSGQRRRGRAPAGRSGAASCGAKVQPGGDGKGKGGAQASPGCSVSRGRGSSRQRRREAGPAGRLGAAPRGVTVQAGGDGGGRRGAGHLSRVRRLAGAGAPRRRGPARLPAPARGLIPVCLVRSGDRAGAGAPCAPPQHPEYIYQRVVSPEAPATPSLVTQSGQAGLPGRTKAAFRPHSRSSLVSALCVAALRVARPLHCRPDRPRSGPSGADPGRDARPGITGVLSRCAGRPSPRSPCVFTQVREGWRFQRWPAPAPGRREPAAPAHPDRPHPLCRARPTSRFPLPPSPRA